MFDALILRVVLDNINNSMLQEEFSASIWRVDGEKKRLCSAIVTIRDVLEDAEEKQFNDKEIRFWLKKLKDAAYDAGDILDKYGTKTFRFEVPQVSRSFSSWFNFEQFMFPLKIGYKITNITERFDDIANERFKFHLKPRRGTMECTVDDDPDKSSSFIPTDAQVCGRDEDKEELGTFSIAHNLKRLSEDDCWALFKQRAFHNNGRGENAAKLAVIGKEIVKKCGGVPLAAKALGGLLRFKHKENEWLAVRDSEIWEQPEEEEKLAILPALRLTYYHLPSHLRQCFAYCSMFPKDYEIEKENLVHLWMANGFIPSPSKGNMELEDIGNEIFNELLWRSLFQEERKDGDGHVVSCKMHDLVHDLASSVMDNECLAVTTEGKIVPKGIRHLSYFHYFLPSSDLFLPSSDFCEYQTLNTLLLLYAPLSVEFNFSNLRCLRALDFTHSQISITVISDYRLLSSIAYLIHLRYLNLSFMPIIILPESLSNLKHLQTLILLGCFHLHNLPAHMSKMGSLRHLDVNGCRLLTHMPSGMGQLIHLQTLSMFIVGWLIHRRTAYRFNLEEESGCHISELQGLNLRGSLCIKGLENVKNSMEAKEANLIRKRNLESLTLSWSWSPKTETNDIQENVKEVLEGLQPPPCIKTLEIESYKGMKFPSWMEDLSLQNLVHLELRYCYRSEHLPRLGHLPFLKFLVLKELVCVQYLGTFDDGLGEGFLSLEKLVLSDMQNLVELLCNVPQGREVFPRLVSLEIRNCDKLTTLPLLPSLQHFYS